MTTIVSPTRRVPTRLVATVAVVCAGLFALSACGARQDDGKGYTYTLADGTTRTVAKRSLAATPLEASWDLDLGGPALRAWIGPQLPNQLCFQMTEAKGYEILAVDALSGSSKWVTPTFGRPPKVPAGASHIQISGSGANAVYDDRMWTIAEDVLYSYDAVYGQLVWRHPLPFAVSTGPLAVGPLVLMGDWEGRVHALTWHPDRHFVYEAWQFNVHAPILAPLLEAEGQIYVADQAGVVHSFNTDRAEVWRHDTGAAITGGLAARGRVLFVGNDDNKVFAFNRLTGDPMGTVFVNGPVRKAPLVYQAEPDRVYVFVDHADPAIGGLVCIRTQLDTVASIQAEGSDAPKLRNEIMRMDVAWRIPAAKRLVGSTPAHLFVTAADPALVLAVNRRTGLIDWVWNAATAAEAEEKNWRGKTTLVEYVDAADANRSVYAIDEVGHVASFRMFGDKAGDPGMPRAPLPAVIPDAPAPEKPVKKKAAAVAPAETPAPTEAPAPAAQ
jgi:outer membrane protein assembly factor BamB